MQLIEFLKCECAKGYTDNGTFFEIHCPAHRPYSNLLKEWDGKPIVTFHKPGKGDFVTEFVLTQADEH